VGENIDRVRKECGWSFDKLAEKTGIDKKSILSRVNKGTKPHPATLRIYAQAFTRELQRTITVFDLEH
jgi:transcriptional regulator with XRE-family HTH domain